MSARWFRFYADAMRNPKVARLSDKQFRLWVQLLSVAAENDGIIPPVDDLKVVLNRRLDHLLTGVKELLSAGLIDSLEHGYEPHHWSKFQYKSDTSNERVARHRAKRNVTVTPPETETDTETEYTTDVVSTDAGARDGVDDGEIGEDQPAKPKPSPPNKRGTRMTPDWQPEPLPDSVLELASLWPDGRVKREFEEFRDYWIACTRNATKLDWDRTWHNRIRQIHDRVIGTKNGTATPRTGTGQQQPDDGIVDPWLRACVAGATGGSHGQGSGFDDGYGEPAGPDRH